MITLRRQVWIFLRNEFGNSAVPWAIYLEEFFSLPWFSATELHRQVRSDLERLDSALKGLNKALAKINELQGEGSSILKVGLDRKGSSLDLWHEELFEVSGEIVGAKTELKKNQTFLAPTGGRDVMAVQMAEALSQYFLDANEPVTFGQSYLGDPSTRYGRTVCFMLEFLGYETHWRRVAEAGFQYAKRHAIEPKS